ncbi:hypothetical protein [Bartonella sp. CB175]|uniref:hypothetical protein n=1 Tax=Bartonella sp. CB175 TaxID=3112256 RepID=UPI00300E65EA
MAQNQLANVYHQMEKQDKDLKVAHKKLKITLLVQSGVGDLAFKAKNAVLNLVIICTKL